jgi:SAM-dependent methyltransferase
VRDEFRRTAEGFAARTQGRFAHHGVVEFARPKPGWTVAEIGAGTGNFLALFAGVAGRLVAVDLTPEMLTVARDRHEGLELVAADGSALPFRSGSIDLVASAQALHHIARPVEVLREMRRVVRAEGRVLVVDQTATEKFEEAVAMDELERLRDPSHAASRPPSAFRTIVRAAGLEVVDERLVEVENRLSEWMWPGEFPVERIDAVRAFIAARGAQTGMGFRPDGDDFVFTRRRILLLARRAPDGPSPG